MASIGAYSSPLCTYIYLITYLAVCVCGVPSRGAMAAALIASSSGREKDMRMKDVDELIIIAPTSVRRSRNETPR